MDEVEALAVTPEYNIREITLCALSRICASDAQFWLQRVGFYNPKAPIFEDWYKSRGYEVYKRFSKMEPDRDENLMEIGLVVSIALSLQSHDPTG